jgi:hypothetical protein
MTEDFSNAFLWTRKERTVRGTPLPAEDDVRLGRLAWLIAGYQEALVTVAVRRSRPANFGEVLSSALNRAIQFETIGDLPDDLPRMEMAVVCSAIGLLRLDQLVSSLSRSSDFVDLLLAWDQVTDAYMESHCHSILADAESGALARSALARTAANARHARSPKAMAKLSVKECWHEWQKHPERYKGPTAFARDMLDKWPNDLVAVDVILRWIRDWKTE